MPIIIRARFHGGAGFPFLENIPMLSSTIVRRGVQLTAVLVSLSLATACDDDDPFVPDDEPDVRSVVVTVTGGSVVTFTGATPSGNLTVGNGSVITVQFRGANDQLDPIAHSSGDFELRVEIPTNTVGLTFTRSTTNPFSGTFTRTGTTATPIQVTFQLWHIADGHNDGEWETGVIVQ